uniref:Rap guanine nucleotide exchange factor (GEF)-like 1 n=1 Tax=Astyanax mexicanus TaxID=7994 RepID=A0A8B9RJQ2_ASTMX
KDMRPGQNNSKENLPNHFAFKMNLAAGLHFGPSHPQLTCFFSFSVFRAEEDKESRKKQVRPLFRHFRRIDACLQPREAFRGSDEIFCRVYTPDHSYVTIRSRLSCRVGEILALVREKLQYSEDQPTQPANLILVAVTSSGEKAVFRPSDEAVFTTLGVNTHLFACEPSELEALMPLPEEIHWSPGDSKLHDMSAEEVANQLVVFDWELFSCVHEVRIKQFSLSDELETVTEETVNEKVSQHFCSYSVVNQMLQNLCIAVYIFMIIFIYLSLISLFFSLSLSLVVMEAEPSPSHLQTKAYVRQLQVIDNQNLLFEMSCKLEPKDM